jgi:hypothetical protein
LGAPGARVELGVSWSADFRVEAVRAGIGAGFGSHVLGALVTAADKVLDST